jgi:uncharacterized protein
VRSSSIHISIFARAPVAGLCKTRLAVILGPERAAEFAARSLDALIERLHPLPVAWSLAPASARDAAWFAQSGYAECVGEVQVAGDLGRRMHAAHREAFGEGAGISAILGSDCPDVPLERLVDQLREGLHLEPEIPKGWLCPTADGGYWCYAVNRAALPRMGSELDNVDWSSGRELAQSQNLLQSRDIAMASILPGHDVDTYEDFSALIQRLEWATSVLHAKHDVPRWQRRLLLALHDMLGAPR